MVSWGLFHKSADNLMDPIKINNISSNLTFIDYSYWWQFLVQLVQCENFVS